MLAATILMSEGPDVLEGEVEAHRSHRCHRWLPSPESG